MGDGDISRPMKHNFVEHLNEKVMLGDGAFGIYLFEYGRRQGYRRCFI
jgi:methionine synthase I (cobalamin-dependent)